MKKFPFLAVFLEKKFRKACQCLQAAGYIMHCLASLGGTTLVLSANQVACHKIHLVTRQKSAVHVGSWEVGYVMFWLIFLEGTSLG